MGWPYHFPESTPEQVQLRREALDHYAFLAHMTGYMPVLVSLASRVVSHLLNSRAGDSRGAYDALPNSPVLKSQGGLVGSWRTRYRMVRWWLDGDVSFAGESYGTREQWVMGFGRFLWLLVFCVVGTGDDYLHLTKRFGIIAVSQMPFQYMLALKEFSPMAWAMGSSHEHLNTYHRMLAQVINALLTLHAAFYLNFFVQKGILGKRFFAPVVFSGILSLWMMYVMSGTAMASIRRWSYRVFFITHLVVAFGMPALIFYHAKSSRVYLSMAIGLFLVDLAVRRVRTANLRASLSTIPGTNLVKIVASVGVKRISAFRAVPGSHVYLSIPAESRPESNPYLYELLFNPFTVAVVGDEASSPEITLVTRALNGPLTTHLGRLSAQNSHAALHPASAHDSTTRKLSLEGPFGSIARVYPSLLAPGAVDRVLLVAGGIGATFTVPIYRALRADHPSLKVELVWSVRSAAEATWAVAPGASDILNDSNVHLYLTGDGSDSLAPDPSRRASLTSSSDAGSPDIELSGLSRDRGRHGRSAAPAAAQNRRRPDLRKVVDDVFRHGAGERIAILTCGPEAMTKELREHVGDWVYKGREVLWHNEGFGW